MVGSLPPMAHSISQSSSSCTTPINSQLLSTQMINTFTPPYLIKTISFSFPPISNTTNRNTLFAFSLPHQPRATLRSCLPGMGPMPTFSQSNSSSSAPIALNNTDLLSQHILRSQFYQKTRELFDGQPQKFHAWLNILERKMSGL